MTGPRERYSPMSPPSREPRDGSAPNASRAPLTVTAPPESQPPTNFPQNGEMVQPGTPNTQVPGGAVQPHTPNAPPNGAEMQRPAPTGTLKSTPAI
jgi:hypothetical protein